MRGSDKLAENTSAFVTNPLETESEATLGGCGAITDAGWFARAGIPVVVYGPGDIAQAQAVALGYSSLRSSG